MNSPSTRTLLASSLLLVSATSITGSGVSKIWDQRPLARSTTLGPSMKSHALERAAFLLRRGFAFSGAAEQFL
jgi:hypothetical protein